MVQIHSPRRRKRTPRWRREFQTKTLPIELSRRTFHHRFRHQWNVMKLSPVAFSKRANPRLWHDVCRIKIHSSAGEVIETPLHSHAGLTKGGDFRSHESRIRDRDSIQVFFVFESI